MITLCGLLLLAYVFDINSSKIKVPSVILLLILGWIVKQSINFFHVELPDLEPILPILGTMGLVLIVLEGSLELEITKRKLPFIGKSFLIAFFAILAFSLGFGYILHAVEGIPLKFGLANAIPFAVISSAIAIPSVQNLISRNKEFVVYESSLSDILGVVFFNFIVFNEHIGFYSIGDFILKLIFILIISFVVTLCLSYLMSKINHTVKYTPIIITLILIYAASKTYHLPALVFIMLFGIFLANIDKLQRYRHIQKLQPEVLKAEVHKFRDLTAEIAFLVRSLFFLLFGFLVEVSELINTETILWAVGISAFIYLVRFLLLKIFKISLMPLLYVAPRGLITILLFLSIPSEQSSIYIDRSLIIQVIIITTLVMTFGMMPNKGKKRKKQIKPTAPNNVSEETAISAENDSTPTEISVTKG